MFVLSSSSPSSSCMLHQTPFRIFKELNAKYCHTFFLSQEFQSGDPGIPVSKLDSICPGKTWELLQIRKTKTCVQENSSCLLVWHRRLCMATFFFTRTRLKTFFSIFLLYSPSLCDWIFKDGSTEINGNNCA